MGNYPYKYLDGPNFGVWFDERGKISSYDDSGWLDKCQLKDPVKHLYFQFDEHQRETNSNIYQRNAPAIYVYAEYDEETRSITIFNYPDGPKNKQPPTSTTTAAAPPPPPIKRARKTKTKYKKKL